MVSKPNLRQTARSASTAMRYRSRSELRQDSGCSCSRSAKWKCSRAGGLQSRKISHWEKQRPEFPNGERPGVVRYREKIRRSALRARGLNGEGERSAVTDGIAQHGRNDAADRKRRGECVRFQRAAQFLPEERFAARVDRADHNAVRVEKVHG